MASTRSGNNGVPIDRLDVSAYTVPTDSPESDGTISWDSTTLVLVEASAGGKKSVGYSYADVATAKLVKELLLGAPAGETPGRPLAPIRLVNYPPCFSARRSDETKG